MTHDVHQAMRQDWLSTLRRYFLFSALGHLMWEALHVQLYTIWVDGTWAEIGFAVVHCTGGDLLIAVSTLLLAMFLTGNAAWPAQRAGSVLVLAVVFGVSYTVFSEWLNIEVRGAWAYREAMPVVPLLNAGLTPLLQWMAVPTIAFLAARRMNARPFDERKPVP